MSTQVDVASSHEDGAANTDAALWKEMQDAEKPTNEADGGSDPAAGAAGKEVDAGAERAAAKPSKADDLWANASPAQKAAWEQAQHEIRSNRSRVAASTRKINALMAGKADAAAPAGAAATGAKAGDPNAIFEDTDWKQFETEYGDVAKPLKKAIGNIAATNESLKRELATHSTQRVAEHYDEQAQIAIERHSDFNDAVKSPEFVAWFNASPTYVQDGVRRNGQNIVDGNEAADLMSKFKTETGYGPAPRAPGAPTTSALANRRQQQLLSAAAPRTGGPAKFSNEIPEDPEAAWKAYAALEAAQDR